MYPCPLSWVAIGRVFVYYARAARAFSAGIKCRHCRSYHITNDTVNNAYDLSIHTGVFL